MTTAFQSNAFQNNAFQIDSGATVRADGQIPRRRREHPYEQAMREDQELIEIIKAVMPFIDGRQK